MVKWSARRSFVEKLARKAEYAAARDEMGVVYIVIR